MRRKAIMKNYKVFLHCKVVMTREAKGCDYESIWGKGKKKNVRL